MPGSGKATARIGAPERTHVKHPRVIFRTLIRGMTLIVSLVVLGMLVEHMHPTEMLNQGWFDTHVRGQGLSGMWVFIGLTTLTTGVGFPRQIVSFLGGYAFGAAVGTLLGLIGTILGSVLSFYYAHWFAHDLVANHFPGRVRKLNDFLTGHTFSMAVILRLLPVGSNIATNLAAGVCRIPALPFLAGSGLGFLPQTLIFALVGSGVHMDAAWQIGIGTALFIASGWLGVRLYGRIDRQRRYGLAGNPDEVAE